MVALPGFKPENIDLAGSGIQKAGENFESSGFAGAVGADEADQFAFGDFKRNIVHCLDVVIFAVKQ